LPAMSLGIPRRLKSMVFPMIIVIISILQ
jgi:hypothetical protein